jgi:hypothetical protein
VWRLIVFMQDEEASNILDQLERDGSESVIRTLAQDYDYASVPAVEYPLVDGIADHWQRCLSYYCLGWSYTQGYVALYGQYND